ncbi:magnesium-transporting ATPase (P-type) [Paraburkholderia sp. WC7.3d]
MSSVDSATPWHAIPAGDIERQFNVDSAQGLDATEAAGRLATYGPNRLPQGKKKGPVARFLMQLHNILIYVLLAAGFVKFLLGLWLDGSVILAVVILNSLLGFLQEGRAEKALDSIRNMLSAEARVLRGAEVRLIPAEELVPGDIVLLESGDKIPADMRLVDARNLRTEEAALTGESVPAEKSTAQVPAKATVGDRENMAFCGTMVLSGRATGVVVATGSQTELGRINQMLAEVSALETPLLRQIKKFGYVITAVIACVSVLLFSWGHWLGHMTFVELFQAIVGIAVSVIPEGLPALITITLAIGVQRMARRNAIIRRLPAVETLGAVSRICSDKTGTLTLMEMMVTSVVTAEAAYAVTGDGYASEGEVSADGKPLGAAPDVLKLMGRVSLLCNDAELFEEDGKWKVEGDPTEGALYPFAAKLGMDRAAETAAGPRIDAIPFESEHKFMATLNRSADGEMLLVKGAPEVILDHCDRQQTAQGPAPLDREHFATEGDRLAAQGERVLGLAWLSDPGLRTGGLGPQDLPRTLVLLGLVGLMDPPRKEAIDAVRECHGGGIRVTMITGDHKITAAAIARMLGIGDGKTAVSGTEIEAMNDAALMECVRGVDVFARASPEHKLRLVKAIQANRQIVAMTGDGVNDAPALKKADIGVAMGDQGHRGDQGGGRDDPRRRQFRVDLRGGEGGAHGLQQHREGDAVHVADQCRARRGDRGGDPVRIHAADHGPADPVGQHDYIRGARPDHFVRATRGRRDEPFAPSNRPADRHALRHLAHPLRGRGARALYAIDFLLDEGARGVGSDGAHGRGQRHYARPGVLSAQHPLSARLVAVGARPSGQSLSVVRNSRCRGLAASVHLYATVQCHLRHRGSAPVGVGVARRWWRAVFLRGGNREARLSTDPRIERIRDFATGGRGLAQ